MEGYTVFKVVWIIGRYPFIFFALILATKFIKKRQIPDSANFIPLIIGLMHSIFRWIRIYYYGVMVDPEKILKRPLEIIYVGALFSVILILIDVVRGLLKKEIKDSEPIK